jgi:hypothetical protein
MIGAMAKKSGRDIDFDLISKVTGSAVSGVAGYYFASKLLTVAALPLLAAFPLAGIPAVVGMNGALNAIFTHRQAKIVLELTRFHGPIGVKRSGSAKGVKDGQNRETLPS